jgi:pectinesterase
MVSGFLFKRCGGLSFRSGMGWRQSRTWLVVFLLAVGQTVLTGGESLTAQPMVRIVLVGDSTVMDKSGWGLGFKAYVKDGAECINTAMGGRSSKSFMDEGRWTNALALHGDYYLIQFAHNNEPGKPGRSTDMATFVHNMETYVDQTRAMGARPILVTPLTRRQWDKTDKTKIKSSLEPYAEAVKKIAAEKKVPVLDLHSRSIELCERFGQDGCKAFSPLKVVDGTNTLDNTHLNAQGSFLFASLVVAEIRKVVPDLARYLGGDTSAPLPPSEHNPVDARTNSGADSAR